MRINKFLALHTSKSRRALDVLVTEGRVTVNGSVAVLGQDVSESDTIAIDGKRVFITIPKLQVILLHKPVGFVCSRDGQGSRTVYDLLPKELHTLKPVGRLDKDSSGLLVMTNDGALAHQLTHPTFKKTKVYEIRLNVALQPLHRQMISDHGLVLEDGISKFHLERMSENDDRHWRVIMSEGRNRQIRRTFSSLQYTVKKLHRIQFGEYNLGDIGPGVFKMI
jgi:23S rRNA pseudouridine2605 synthase